MKLSENLFSSARFASSPAHAGFLRDCAQQARQLETAAIDQDVAAAYRKFGGAAPHHPVQEPDPTMLEARMKHLREEVRELELEIEARSMVGIIAEGIDVIYTVLGIFVGMGVPFMPFWKAVANANLAKVKEPGGGKWLKPEGWRAPNHHKILYSMRRQAEGME
tara:strand:+ start:2509 stop:3000 length:492 start_codon:yes stop_codon:yes gene_type:complete